MPSSSLISYRESNAVINQWLKLPAMISDKYILLGDLKIAPAGEIKKLYGEPSHDRVSTLNYEDP